MEDSLRATRDEVDKVVSEVIRKGVTVSSTEIADALLARFDVHLRVPAPTDRPSAASIERMQTTPLPEGGMEMP